MRSSTLTALANRTRRHGGTAVEFFGGPLCRRASETCCRPRPLPPHPPADGSVGGKDAPPHHAPLPPLAGVSCPTLSAPTTATRPSPRTHYPWPGLPSLVDATAHAATATVISRCRAVLLWAAAVALCCCGWRCGHAPPSPPYASLPADTKHSARPKEAVLRTVSTAQQDRDGGQGHEIH